MWFYYSFTRWKIWTFELINEYNEKNPKDKMDLPTIRVIITDDDYALKRKDGIYIIPLAALKN